MPLTVHAPLLRRREDAFHCIVARWHRHEVIVKPVPDFAEFAAIFRRHRPRESARKLAHDPIRILCLDDGERDEIGARQRAVGGQFVTHRNTGRGFLRRARTDETKREQAGKDKSPKTTSHAWLRTEGGGGQENARELADQKGLHSTGFESTQAIRLPRSNIPDSTAVRSLSGRLLRVDHGLNRDQCCEVEVVRDDAAVELR